MKLQKNSNAKWQRPPKLTKTKIQQFTPNKIKEHVKENYYEKGN